MATSEETKIPLTVVIDREKNKVVFAEANSDFVDILFSFLTLPMGTILRLLGKHSGSIGSFSTLYESIANLDAEYFGTEECKAMLLNPRNSAEAECRKLRLNIDDTKPTEYFICENWGCSRGSYGYFSTYDTAKCNECKKLFNREIRLKDSNVNQSEGNEGVFVTQTASFAISDDLHVIPNMPGSTLGLLNNSGIRDFRALEERKLKIGFNEIYNLLKFTINSKTPLTDMFLGKKQIISDMVKFEPARTAQPQGKTTNSRKMTVKVLLQKSNNKLLLAQCEEDFIDFLFSFLTIPLGRVVSLLSGNISVPGIENLHRSMLNLDVGRYIKSQELKDMLLYPRLGSQHLCSNQIFSLVEATTPKFYCCTDYSSGQYTGYMTVDKHKSFGHLICCDMTIKNPKGKGGFVRWPTMFMVTDDLVVTPLSSMSCFTYLNDLKVPPSDVEEQAINIGMDEALNLLKASLKYTSALTNGLDLILKKIKQEK